MNNKKVVSCALAAVMAMQGGGVVFAGEKDSNQLPIYENKVFNGTKNVSKNKFSEYDKYVKVIGNRYVFELPDYIKISNETLNEIKAQIECTNNLIAKENLTLNPCTKSAIILGKCADGEGVNSIEFYWNYMHINISASSWRIILSAGVGAAEGVIMELLSVSGPTAMGIAGAIWGGLSSMIGEYVQDGVWFDLNYFFNFLDKWGTQ